MINIAISSGKGGTGKTFISTNIARALEKSGEEVHYLDCDVEEPNGHLFLKPRIDREEEITIISPVEADKNKCTGCGKCAEVCNYNAIAVINEKVLFFKNLCHVCGACTIVCPENAIIEKERKIGCLKHGKAGKIDFHYGLLETAEGGMSPRLIRKVKKCAGAGINILDSSPGTACPVVETVKDADICVLVTDPTPFGINDLKLAVNMCRLLDKEPVVLVNRAEYMNEDLKLYCGDEELEIICEVPDDRKIAECYSDGGLVFDKMPQYRDLFIGAAKKIVRLAKEKRPVKNRPVKTEVKSNDRKVEKGALKAVSTSQKTKELVIISGKGGTGKTSMVSCFCALEKDIVISDCDVDAADLHLILNPEIKERGYFSGGSTAEIDEDKCTGCGECFDKCRFDAIRESRKNNKKVFIIDDVSCEGCGVCCLVCKHDAVKCGEAINGEWYISDTRFGPMSHAKLGVAEENSGRLVTLVRNKKEEMAAKLNIRKAIIDGSPGTGCPVIASLTGADYALVVTEPTVSGIHDLKRILDVVNFFKLRSGIVVNKYDLNKGKTDEIKNLSVEYNAEFLGMIPYDKAITEAQVKGLALVEYTKNDTTKKIEEIWKKIRSRSYE